MRLRKCRFRISIPDQGKRKNFVANTGKETESSCIFKSKLKNKLVDFDNEATFF